MFYPVYCLMTDGPCAGEVFELDVNARTIQIKGDAKEPGAHCYRRTGWSTSDKGHRIALFKHTKTLVV
jgi:hypothetical protein